MRLRVSISISPDSYTGAQIVHAEVSEELVGIGLADEDRGEALYGAIDKLADDARLRAITQAGLRREIAAKQLIADEASRV